MNTNKARGTLQKIMGYVFSPSGVMVTVRISDGKLYQFDNDADRNFFTSKCVSEEEAMSLPLLNDANDTFVKLIAARAFDTINRCELRELLATLKNDPTLKDSALVAASKRYPTTKPKAIYEAMAYYHEHWDVIYGKVPPVVDNIFMKIKQELKNLESTRVEN